MRLCDAQNRIFVRSDQSRDQSRRQHGGFVGNIIFCKTVGARSSKHNNKQGCCKRSNIIILFASHSRNTPFVEFRDGVLSSLFHFSLFLKHVVFDVLITVMKGFLSDENFFFRFGNNWTRNYYDASRFGQRHSGPGKLTETWVKEAVVHSHTLSLLESPTLIPPIKKMVRQPEPGANKSAKANHPAY